ncbi:hypothetical protein AB4622_07500 [Vibrio splendidus]|uniref:hypothetical protein n=1 Tax=Vibrio sp. R78045 TaxID=3093868 RepID=UPI0035528F21
MFSEIKEDFREWLIVKKGVSKRVAGDTISRCKRLDEEILDSIDLAVSSVDNYLLAMSKIKHYARENGTENGAKYAMTGCLRSAMRKYCEYRNPEDISYFPSAYNL